ncbi:UDP-glucose 4-epimerase family protein [Fibrobacterota bacterium]
MTTTMRVLITGPTGFIGRPLCEKMAQAGWNVRGAVWEQESDAMLPDGVETVFIKSIGPDTDWKEALQGIEVIIHLAARVHMMKDTATDKLAEYRLINTAGTERLVKEAIKHSVKRIVYISTIKVNGEGSESAYKADDKVCPKDPYGMSKWEAELILNKACDEGGIETVIIRPPLVYGPGVTANFLSLIRLVKSGLPLPLGNARNRRSLVFKGNLMDAIITCATHGNAVGKTFLVSDGNDVSTAELIRQIARSLKKKDRLFPFPISWLRLAGTLLNRTGMVDRLTTSLTVDISKIRMDLDWEPPYSMEQGLAETAAWYLEKYRNGQTA